jgi:SlyX protein
MFRGEISGAASCGPFFVRTGADPRAATAPAARQEARSGGTGPLFHNGGMPHPSHADVDKRLTDLEVKASFSEDLVDHLNDLVARQQAQIELLIREVGKLKERAPDTGGGTTRDPRDELPPHY